METGDKWIRFWNRVRAPLHALALPAFLVFLAAWLVFEGGQGAVSDESVEMAVSILRFDPDSRPDMAHLRTWAIEVVDRHSGVTLPPAAKDHLMTQALEFPLSERDKNLKDVIEAIRAMRNE